MTSISFLYAPATWPGRLAALTERSKAAAQLASTRRRGEALHGGRSGATDAVRIGRMTLAMRALHAA
jgi:hypothetical protein